MKDEKEPLEQKQNSEEEEYSFLQEIIKDEAGDQAKWKHDVLRRIQLGLIFGLVACFTFFACKPWVEKRFEGDPTEVTIPQDEQQEENQTQQEEEQVQEQKTVLTTETYQEMLNNLKQVSGEVRKSVVEIQGAVTEEEFSKDQEDKEKSISGMIVADNGQELLILAGELPVKDAKIIRVTNDCSCYYRTCSERKRCRYIRTALRICRSCRRRTGNLGNTCKQHVTDRSLLIPRIQSSVCTLLRSNGSY